MSNHILRRFACFLLTALWLAMPGRASNLILDLASGVDVRLVAANYGLTVIKRISKKNNVYLVSVDDASQADVTAAMAADPAITDIDPAVAVSAPATPFDQAADPTTIDPSVLDQSSVDYFGATVKAFYAQQPGASLIHLPDALATLATGSGIVAIIDTGVDPTHPALSGSLLPGYDFTRNTPGGSELADLDQSTVAILDQSTVAILDTAGSAPILLNQSTVAILDQSTVAILDASQLPADFGHGTMVAGLVHLVAPTAQILPLKAFDANGTADIANIVRAVYYAVNHHADVINMSFSSYSDSPALAAALQYAQKKGVICVASFGNSGTDEVVYPAADRGVIGIASTDASDRRSAFSDYDRLVNMSALGEALITTFPGGGYAAAWGTSFSTALVSGTAALLNQVSTRLDNEDIVGILGHGRRARGEGIGESTLDVLMSLQYSLNRH